MSSHYTWDMAERIGKSSSGPGFNAYKLSSVDFPAGTTGLQISNGYDQYPLATTQEHHSMEGRSYVEASFHR